MEPTPAKDGGAGSAFAWLVHAITASGAVIALLALAAIERGDLRLALLWLLLGLAIDGVDGTLARAARTKERAARIDGDTLDLVVDYLTYVFVPTLFIWRGGFVPEAWALPLAAAIQLSSLYLFARTDMKTEDNYFRGFPALWNVVAFYLFAAQAGPEVGAGVVCLFVLMTFAPVHFVHPFRVRDYGVFLPLLAIAWALATVALLWTGWSEAVRGALLCGSAGAAILMLALGLLRTVRGPRPAK
jgi:phosphatidylcholine synthase